jgi:hypothetical protein
MKEIPEPLATLFILLAIFALAAFAIILAVADVPS